MRKNILIGFICLLSITKSAFAVTLPDAMRESMSHDYGIPSVMNLVLSMIFVIALIYITGWVYTKLNLVNRKKISNITKTENNNTQFNVIQSMPLGQQRHLYSIEMNNKILLIGSTPSHINLIKEYDKKSFDNEITSDFTQSNIESDTDTKKTVSNIDELYRKYKN